MKLLVISTVWVEPSSSAAGSRMLQLLDVFLERGYEIVYASTAATSEHAFALEVLGIKTTQILVNDSSFNAFAKTCQPTIVLFDRFTAEEQFGWRITDECPDALKILDTEDLHCLRKAREAAVKQDRSFEKKDLISDVAKREIAAIYRCDLTLMISRYEVQLLQDFFKVPESLVHYIPFLLPELVPDFKSYEERQHFISIGNFLHTPNWDATLQLKQHIWPCIRKELPQAELHVYGAYPSEKVQQLQSLKDGFIIKGRAGNAQEVIASARALLAPLRFGAGLKGKFIDAMQCGTPSVTTTIGSEAMHGELPWSGEVVAYDPVTSEAFYESFAKAAITLYANKGTWEKAQKQGCTIINSQYQKADYEEGLVTRVNSLLADTVSHRLQNFIGQMLLHHTMRSTKFMSKWIEEKNR